MKVVMTRRVTKIEATANDWQLFGFYKNDKDPLYESAAHREKVAESLNKAAKVIANKCDMGHDFVEKMMVVVALPEFAKYGAADTEGRAMIWELANRIYGAK